MAKRKRTLTDEEMKLIVEHTDKITPLRGQLLTNLAEIESILGDTMAFHFYPGDKNKRDEFTSLMIYESGIQFHVKIRLFVKILKLYHKNLYSKFPDLEEDLEKLKTFRNVLAHSRLNVEPKNIAKHPDLFRFEHYKDGKMGYTAVTKDIFSEKLKLASKIFHELLDIQDKISNQEDF